MSVSRSSQSPKSLKATPRKATPPLQAIPVPALRHPYGPRTLAAVLPSVTKSAFARRPVASAQLLADWELIVGCGLAVQTQPRKLIGGTLTVACAGPVALELQHTGDVLIARINRHIGHTLVQRLRLVHDTISAMPTVPAPVRTIPTEGDRAAVARRLADLPEGPLRDALAGLALAMRGG